MWVCRFTREKDAGILNFGKYSLFLTVELSTFIILPDFVGFLGDKHVFLFLGVT
jgi:hypothetical protein